MTKRKASVALDPISDENPDVGAHNGNDSNSNNRTDIVDGTTVPSGVVQHQNDGSSSLVTNVVTNACQELSSNQNDNSIGSNCSGTGNNSSSNSNNNTNNNSSTNSNGGSHKSKKERADNWSSAEIQVLHKGIESRRDIFYGPPSQATKKNRELAWEAITREVNAVSTTPRSLNQVMKKFKNEKCRAKRKFAEPEKEGSSNSNQSGSNHTSINNNNSNANNNNLSGNNNVSNSNHTDSRDTNASTNNCVANDPTPNANLSAQNHANNSQQATQHQMQQQQQQSHHMTNADHSMPVSQPSINVVKLAPQNVAKTMIDLPGHVQQIQMPNDDMVLIVPPDMDGLLSGVNIVSDGNGHHHFQKCSSSTALSNHPHNHHNQHSLQALNTSHQSLVNGTMGGGMMARTLPGSSMCSLVYSTGNEVCAPDHHVTQNISGPGPLASHHLGINAQALTHHRATIDQTQIQQQHHHQLHHQQQPQQQQPQQQQQHQPHQHQQQQSQQPQHLPHHSQLSNPHNQQHLNQSHLTASSSLSNNGGVAVESQIKNLLFNLLLKDGQHPSMPMISPNNQDNKHRNDMLAVIANSLTKIEGHLSKISKVASAFVSQSIGIGGLEDGTDVATTSQIANSVSVGLGMSSSDGNNNNVAISNTGSSMQNARQENERQ